ncbi:MAG: ribosome recycling factor [Bacteroidia bacterium]
MSLEINIMGDHMDHSIEYLNKALNAIRAGKASPSMIESVMVEYYGTPTPINQVGTIAVLDARTLTVSPWERKLIPTIERAIRDANLGFNPASDGEMVRIPIPSLTEDRRKSLTKQARGEGEGAKVSIRNHRHNTLGALRKLKNEGVSEDEIKKAEAKVEEITKEFIRKVDEILKIKEHEIMTV